MKIDNTIVAKLGDIVAFLDARRQPVKANDRKPGPYPYYGANGQQGTIDSFIFDEPLVLLAEDGGHFFEPDRGIAYKVTGKTWVNNHAHVLRPRSGVDIDYLCLVLKHLNITPHLTGTTRAKLTKAGASRIEIPLPPLAAQKRIAAILDAADALRAKRRESLAELDRLLQSTFLDMFGDPVTNPKGWEVVRFGEVGYSRLGKMLDRGKPKGHEVYPYLANFNVQWGQIQLTELRSMEFSEADRQEFTLEHGDVLVCEGGEVGRTAVWRCEKEAVYFQKALHRIRLYSEKAVPEYVQKYMWFMAKNGGFKDFTATSTIAHLTGVKLKKLPFPLPPIDLQNQFATISDSVERQKIRLSAHLAELDTLFASLQSRAFKGEL